MSGRGATLIRGRLPVSAAQLAGAALLAASAAVPMTMRAAAIGAPATVGVTAADSALVRTMLERLLAVTPKPNVKYAWPPRWFIEGKPGEVNA